MRNSYTFVKFVIELPIIAVKSGQLGGKADTFIPIFFADILLFAI